MQINILYIAVHLLFRDDEIDEEDEKVDWILDTIKNPKVLEKYMPNGDQEEINVSCLPTFGSYVP